MTKVSEGLKKAKALIQDKTAWTQGSFARSKRGDALHIKIDGELMDDDEPVCFCSEGAVRYTAKDAELAGEELGYLLKASGCAPVWVFNDNADHDQVMQMFDRAIKLAEEKENESI